MLNRSDISDLIGDLMRTELANHQTDTLATFDDNIEGLWTNLPINIKKCAEEKAAIMFGYMPRTFSSLERMIDYSYASFLKNQQIAFLTSGSTGSFKPCVHTVNMMWEEARGLVPLFEGTTRIISLVPTHHLYGFSFSVILPHVLRIPALHLPALPTQNWQDILQPGDLMVAFPLFWNHWLRGGNKFPEGVHLLSSTAPCKDEIIEGLLNAGAQQFTEIYGSSETGAIAYRHQADCPFEILPFWDISRKEKAPLIKRCSGTVWQPLPDYVVMKNERFLYPMSRRDACVQVGGENIYPKRVEHVLASHPAVKECRVRLMRPEEGERLKAFVVLKEGIGPEQLENIRTFLTQHLTAHEMPRTYTFGEMLPVSGLGKETDW